MRYKPLFIAITSLLPLWSIGQELPSTIFDKEQCGCAIHKDSLASSNYEKTVIIAQKEPRGNALRAQFEGNDVMRDFINRFMNINNEMVGAYNNSLTGILKQLGNKNPEKRQELIQTLSQELQDSSLEGSQVAKSQYAICFIAEQLHLFYFNNPASSHRPEWYQEQQDSIQSSENNGLTEETPNDAVTPNTTAATQTAPEEGGNMLWLVISGLLGIGMIGVWAISSSKRKRLAQEVEDLKIKQQSMQQKLQQENEDLKAKIRELEAENSRLKKEVAQKEATIQEYKQHFDQQKNTNQQTNVTTPQNTVATNTISSFLSAPNEMGVFMSNGVSPQRNPDSIYEIQLNAQDATRGEFYLLKDPAVVQRAESMAQQLLLSACEIRGKGRIPNDMSFQQEAGIVRKDGAGWRIEKKIVLKW